MFGRVLVHVLRNPLDQILKDIQQIVTTVSIVAKDDGELLIFFYCKVKLGSTLEYLGSTNLEYSIDRVLLS